MSTKQTFKPIPVRCPSCGETYLETTEHFDPNKMTNGTMLRLIPKYGPDGLNWSCFPYDEWILGDALECPGCGAPMGGLQGKVNVLSVEVKSDGGQEEGKEQKEETGGAEKGETGQEVTRTNDAHVCPECGRSFEKAIALVGHMKSHDTREKA
ncbi:MAG: hypothetical protein A4E65_00789 [Syntrophorhabdus sp. PtaU1.Bin153]|nr:MAG: hypothetical protein A4E65_00789 [Syntrophorhabdus sp. PtaU1.Bin153]